MGFPIPSFELRHIRTTSVEPFGVTSTLCNGNMRFVKPLDSSAIDSAIQQHDLIVTIEDNAIAGGAGSAVAEYLSQQNVSTNLLQIGFPDELINHGEPEQLLADWHLDKPGILQTIEARVKELLI